MDVATHLDCAGEFLFIKIAGFKAVQCLHIKICVFVDGLDADVFGVVVFGNSGSVRQIVDCCGLGRCGRVGSIITIMIGFKLHLFIDLHIAFAACKTRIGENLIIIISADVQEVAVCGHFLVHKFR